MRVDVVMPQMGESIAEGTISRWMKKVGDKVERDEPILEISTDKVDAEIPAPASGVVAEIRNKEGETVAVDSVIAVIDTEAAAGAKADAPEKEKKAGDKQAAAKREREPEPERRPAKAEAREERSSKSAPAEAEDAGKAEGTARFVSPVVRKIAEEHGVDPARIEGTGAGGRVTKKDMLAHVERGGDRRTEPAPPRSTASAPAPAPAAPVEARAPRAALTTQPDAPAFAPGESTARTGMTQMRRKIAEHMLESRRTSAHVHSVFEVDVTRVEALRARYKQSYAERHSTKLTFLPFVVKAVCGALRAWPIVNSSVEGDEIVYKKDLNVGIAVALDWGLIVPVVRNADELSLAGLSKRIQDLAERSRTKKLNPDEVQGGTFTITNPGGFGGLFGLPIINQPQVAILGLGGIQKRPVVIEGDAIAIRSMVYLAMSYDHRVVDGAVADQFLARVKNTLENFDETLL
jgi:2-oxoglutarate dehydrogenase E2 component (dihydrolipoamide succinyltransferase)